MSSISRTAHCLKREKSLAMPRHIIFVDTETIQEELDNGSLKQNLKMGWACYYRKGYGRHLPCANWHFFKEAASFWQFVFGHCEKKRKLWIIARNIDFDFTVLNGWKYLRQARFKLKFFHNQETTTVISVRGDNGSIIFADSMNWFRESLRETGERIGLPKLDIDFETCTDKKLSNYCHRDVEIELENFKQFIKFLEDNQISRLRYTIASTAMSAFLFSFSDKKIYIHNNKEAIDLERDSYRGGRTECFFIGELKNDNYYVLDVNSLYPFVMRNNLYPVKYIQILTGAKLRDVQTWLQNGSVIAKVLIETDEPVYAVKKDRTIFPTGVFWVTLTTPELKYAIAKGHLLEIESAVLYSQAHIFTKYVDRLYKLRLGFSDSDNKIYAKICKLLLNSLYGKFGQKQDVWKKVGLCPDEPDRIETCYKIGVNNPLQIRYLLGEIFELVGYEETFNSFPAIASHVTSYARMVLYEFMKRAGAGNYYYCDTDSLIINEVGKWILKEWLHDTELGYLRLVEKTRTCTIRGLKDYSIGTKQVIKGIKKDAVKIADGFYEQQLWPSLKGLLRRRSPNTYVIGKTLKVLDRVYSKGTVNRDGTVTPPVLDESGLPF